MANNKKYFFGDTEVSKEDKVKKVNEVFDSVPQAKSRYRNSLLEDIIFEIELTRISFQRRCAPNDNTSFMMSYLFATESKTSLTFFTLSFFDTSE